METPAHPTLLTDDSDKNHSPAFPLLVPFSQEDKVKVKSFIKQTILAWCILTVGIVVFISWKGLICWTDWLANPFLYDYNRDTWEFVLLLSIITAIAVFTIRQVLKDTRNGVKQTGLIEVISKITISHYEESTTYQVEFKWLADPKGSKVVVNDSTLYGQLQTEDVAYLEILPFSKEILLIQKQGPGIDPNRVSQLLV